jgi:hypothetical protein
LLLCWFLISRPPFGRFEMVQFWFDPRTGSTAAQRRRRRAGAGPRSGVASVIASLGTCFQW